MTIDELRKLLTAVAKTDRRTIGRDDIDFWAAMAREGQWTLDTAMRALIQFRATRPGEWLEPGHLSQIVREAHRKAANSFVEPDAMDGETGRQYVERRRRLMREHIARVMEAWAVRGEPIPESASAAELASGGGERLALPGGTGDGACPPELREKITRAMSRIGRMPARVVDPAGEERRRRAREELDALRGGGEAGSRDGAA